MALREVVNLSKTKLAVELYVTPCEGTLAKEVAEKDEMNKLVDSNATATSLITEFECWMKKLTESNDNILANARAYVDTLNDRKVFFMRRM